ncbi:MAG: BatA domain-containing protein, partial [Pseudomonadota bacterium]
MFSSLAFATPALLVALVALPILWWLLRAVPPAPIRRRFPGVALLLGLTDEDSETDKTPWWLLLLRALAIAAAIIAFAGPFLNPTEDSGRDGPLLVAMDGSWASARDWPQRLERVEVTLQEAARRGRPLALVLLTDLPSGDLAFQTSSEAMARLDNLTPAAWAPDMEAATAWAEAIDGPAEVLWVSDGLDRPGRDDLLDAFEALGPVTVVEGARDVRVIGPPQFAEGRLEVTAERLGSTDPLSIEIVAHG